MRILPIACAVLGLATACSGSGDAPSADQNHDMDRAAELLDEAPNSLAQIDNGVALDINETAPDGPQPAQAP